MNSDESSVTLTPEESARMVALAATATGGVLLLYLLDHLIFGRIDPSYLLMWPLLEQSGARIGASEYAVPVVVILWGGIWMLSGIQAVRSRGSRRVAISSLAVLIGGIILSLGISFMERNSMFRGGR